MRMRILEPSCAPYSSRWFTVPKKNGALRFIQDMQPVNAVTIRNVGVGPIVDEFAEAFARMAIYSMSDLYSSYDQFQLAEESRDVTTMRTPLGLVRMCTLPQGATNSVAHMMAGMNKILKEFIPEKTMPFLDDVPIKGCREDEKNETLDQRGCRKYVVEHIEDCEKILSRLEEVHLTLSEVKSTFGVKEIVIVRHLCGTYGRKPDPAKVEVIQRIREIKRELWGLVTAMNAEKEYLLGVEVVVETDCLPLLGMITNCTSTDMTMLNWIAYIKTLNPEFRHIAMKDNPVADMLSRVRYDGEEEMVEDTDIDDIGTEFYSIAQMGREDEIAFMEDLYDGEWLELGWYLATLRRLDGWTDADFKRIKKKAYDYMVRDGYLWRRHKHVDGVPRRVVCDRETQVRLMKEFHESLWAGHRGIWATFMKLKERYWWRNMYKYMVAFVESCTTCQVYSNIRHRDGLHPTYPLAIHFKWIVDLVTMLVGLWQMRYLVLAREDLSNQVEGRALRRNTTEAVCRFLLEDVVCRYGCVGKITADGGELNAQEARDFFERYRLKFSLTTAYNPEEKVYDNATYGLRELDGARLRRPIAGKRVKIFKKRNKDMDMADMVGEDRIDEDEDGLDDNDEVM
ncbi:hypothetical protein R1sor_012280 [Riccia sorocarpa]|uniref:Integrase catalytic domain-containing protein n=1 Tax=Riccia sorocarpa TaxID=122646 RepID=A0ABD3I6N1_9MARC